MGTAEFCATTAAVGDAVLFFGAAKLAGTRNCRRTKVKEKRAKSLCMPAAHSRRGEADRSYRGRQGKLSTVDCGEIVGVPLSDRKKAR